MIASIAGPPTPQHTAQQSDAMPQGEEADVLHDILQPVKKEDDRDVIVAG